MEQEKIEVSYLRAIIIPLLTEPDELSVVSSTDQLGVLITMNVNQKDMGKVIGRSGETAKSIRTLLRAFGIPHHMRINLKIQEPEGSTRYPKNNTNTNEYNNFDQEIKDL